MSIEIFFAEHRDILLRRVNNLENQGEKERERDARLIVAKYERTQAPHIFLREKLLRTI